MKEREQSQERTSKNLTQQEVDLLMRFAQGMAKGTQSFYCLDPLDPKLSPDSEREYLGQWFRFHIQSDALLELTESYSKSSAKRRLRNVGWFVEKILASNNLMFSPDDITRLKWAAVAREVVQDILGLRRDNGIIQLRNEIIRKLKLRRMSQEEICKELDLDEELRQSDPRLKKWRDEFLLDPRLSGYHTAFTHTNPKLRGRMKKIISVA